ncbi:MAG: molybdopterin molybdotransferase MoeA [Desulfamplus sp.]|nr:molybdopterin molybdotransferase MoeA [Desulfamplus sp.]MBF0389090.1 molybdopterin molybdotransferase MoeA [Desulfamplus sp.]
MSHFFKVQSLEQVMQLVSEFEAVATETLHISKAYRRLLAKDIYSDQDIPGFKRATMDGYAIYSGSSFGASESNPAWLEVKGSILMGERPNFSVELGQAGKISTGGMLPDGADSVVMVEHTEVVGSSEDKENYSPTVEIYKSVAPLQNVIDKDEDFKKGEKILEAGTILRPQEIGLMAALGISELAVYKIPKIGIISTGDEIVPIDQTPQHGKVRDINSYTLAGLVIEAGAEPVLYGIVKDDKDALYQACRAALDETDMVLISGGSSVGVRDFTVDILSLLKDTKILVHGISISPGKPTILAKSASSFDSTGFDSSSAGYSKIKPIWGLPGHVVSAMVVFKVVVLPFLQRLQGLSSFGQNSSSQLIRAKLTRNVASAQGRREFVRVRFIKERDDLFAQPILGKSGLIRTMVMADGLLEIDENREGLEKGEIVNIIPLRAFS